MQWGLCATLNCELIPQAGTSTGKCRVGITLSLPPLSALQVYILPLSSPSSPHFAIVSLSSILPSLLYRLALFYAPSHHPCAGVVSKAVPTPLCDSRVLCHGRLNTASGWKSLWINSLLFHFQCHSFWMNSLSLSAQYVSASALVTSFGLQS